MPVIKVGSVHANLSPDAFHRWATHYLKCRKDFLCPDPFSPVPYFLLCRAIELELKARHLKHMTQSKVKKNFSHNLGKSYGSLDPTEKILNKSEEHALQLANDIYMDKGFEYFRLQDALTGHSQFPDLALLDSIANKLICI